MTRICDTDAPDNASVCDAPDCRVFMTPTKVYAWTTIGGIAARVCSPACLETLSAAEGADDPTPVAPLPYRAASADVCCSHAEHAKVRDTIESFEAGTVNRVASGDLVMGQCAVAACRSTIALEMCALGCGRLCPASDALPVTKDGGPAHVGCVLRLAAQRGRIEVVS